MSDEQKPTGLLYRDFRFEKGKKILPGMFDDGPEQIARVTVW